MVSRRWRPSAPIVPPARHATFATISNDDAAALRTYVIQSDGKFKRIRNDEEKYRKAYLPTFRACFVPSEPLAKNVLTVRYANIEQGGGDHIDQIIAFPTTNFVGDADFSGYDDDDETGIILHPQEGDGEHHYFDLQGRQLKSRPQKGVYIDNGKKVIK